MLGRLPYKIGPDSAGECAHYTSNGNGIDSVKDCRTCSLERSCIYAEIMLLRNAMNGCSPLYLKPNQTGTIVLDFLRRAEKHLFGLICECHQQTSKGVDLVVPGWEDRKILPIR